jgi:protein-tyrosine phosphatase
MSFEGADRAAGSSIASRFGTSRGLIRLLLAHVQVALGAAKIVAAEPEAVRRLVFVCQGNICRSAFAEALARRRGMASCSFGLSTATGIEAHPPATETARLLGIDLGSHRATASPDYAPRPGDLLLAMEVRQLDRIAADPRLAGLPRSLLGLWATPPRPHLHDPYSLSDAYMRTCFEVIDTAVAALDRAFPNARHTRPS